MLRGTVLIVQHMEWEGPGKHLLFALERAGVGYETCRARRTPRIGRWFRASLENFLALAGLA